MIYKYCCDNVLPLFDTEDQAVQHARDSIQGSEYPETSLLYCFESMDDDKWQIYKIASITKINIGEWLARKVEDR